MNSYLNNPNKNFTDPINLSNNLNGYINNNNDIINKNNNIAIDPNPLKDKKKNRTLQYYKFLFYSIKIEIKTVEFLDLIRFANQTEICVWILSVFLSERGYSDFVWVHTLHFIRGILGFFLLIKFPQSVDLIDQLHSNTYDTEGLIFNDLVRKSVNDKIITPFFILKPWLICYMVFTIINVCLDILDFLYQLSRFDLVDERINGKIYIYINFIFAVVYISVDFCYILWSYTLKYGLPHYLMSPIHDLLGGFVERVKKTFRISKPITNLREEEANQNSHEIKLNKNNVEEIRIDLNDNFEMNNNRNLSNNTPAKVVGLTGFNDSKNSSNNQDYQRAPKN